jgi:DNA-binding MarR family transcriptional regulator
LFNLVSTRNKYYSFIFPLSIKCLVDTIIHMKTHLIYNQVERLGELLKVGSRKAGAEHGLQPIQLEVLHYLSSCNQFSDTPMAVTEYLAQTKGTVSQTIKVLEKKELLTKQADNKDKRISHLKVTQKGRSLINETLPTNMFLAACNTLSTGQQAQITSSLQTLIVSLIQSNNMKSFGVCHSCTHNQKLEDGSYFCKLVKEPLADKDIQLICREHKSVD